jgi:hypothetical protein
MPLIEQFHRLAREGIEAVARMRQGLPVYPFEFCGILHIALGDRSQPLLTEHTMKTRILLPMLLLSAVFVSPGSANWFASPKLGINLNIGSAPSPTPDDVSTGRQPMLVRDADGNVIAMIDSATGKIIATAEPPVAKQSSSAAAKTAPALARAR